LKNKSKLILIIIAGLILAAIGIFASFNLIQRFRVSQAPAESEENIVKTSVVVVTRDLDLGDTIAVSDVELSSIPVELAPRTSISTINEVVGKIIKTDLVQGEMVLSHNLADPTNNNGDLSYILSDDHVLMAFPALDLLSREVEVQRGDIVDIFATFTQKVRTVGEITTVIGEPQEPELRTFTVDTLQKVSITAMVLEVIDEDVDTDVMQEENNQAESRIRAYLLALNPRDALILKHLKDTAAVFDIVLRAPTSTVQFDLTPVTEEYIIEYYGLEILP
jgi:Flp pilus assembly protein CpaB